MKTIASRIGNGLLIIFACFLAVIAVLLLGFLFIRVLVEPFGLMWPLVVIGVLVIAYAIGHSAEYFNKIRGG